MIDIVRYYLVHVFSRFRMVILHMVFSTFIRPR